MAKELRLTDRERALLVANAEGYKGNRVEGRKFDRAMEIIDPGFELSDRVFTAPTDRHCPHCAGLLAAAKGDWSLMPLEEIDNTKEATYAPETGDHEVMKKYFIEAVSGYSRRRGSAARLFRDIVEKVANAEEIKKGGKKK